MFSLLKCISYKRNRFREGQQVQFLSSTQFAKVGDIGIIERVQKYEDYDMITVRLEAHKNLTVVLPSYNLKAI